jgi:hypothetical protein
MLCTRRDVSNTHHSSTKHHSSAIPPTAKGHTGNSNHASFDLTGNISGHTAFSRFSNSSNSGLLLRLRRECLLPPEVVMGAREANRQELGRSSSRKSKEAFFKFPMSTYTAASKSRRNPRLVPGRGLDQDTHSR